MVDNPFLMRYVRQSGGPRPARYWRGVLVLNLLVFEAVLILYWLDRVALYQFAPFIVCPAVLLIAMLIGVAAATVTVRDSTGRSFDLVRLTNIHSRRVVWGVVGGLIYRLHVYLILNTWLLALSGLSLAVALLRFRQFDPTLPQFTYLFLLQLINAGSVSFLLVVGTVAAAFRQRRVFKASSVPTIMLLLWGIATSFGLIALLQQVEGIGGTLCLSLLIYLVPTSGGIALARQSGVRWGVALEAAPHILGWMILALFLVFVARVLWRDLDIQVTFWIIQFGLALFLTWRLVFGSDDEIVVRSVVVLAWHLILLLLFTFRPGDVLVWVLLHHLLLAPLAYALNVIEQARPWVWYVRS